jgi:hypothetical protein
MKNFINAEATFAIGDINLGKYTLPKIAAFVLKVVAVWLKDSAK